MRIDENAFGVSNDLMRPHQAEEKAVVEILLQTRMVTEIGKERTEHMEALVEAVSAANQVDMSVRRVERLSELLWEKIPEAIRQGLIREPRSR